MKKKEFKECLHVMFSVENYTFDIIKEYYAAFIYLQFSRNEKKIFCLVALNVLSKSDRIHLVLFGEIDIMWENLGNVTKLNFI